MAAGYRSRNENLYESVEPFFNINAADQTFDSAQLVIDKRCYGIPFLVDDQRVMDAATQHHRSAIDVHSVERFMVPFWLGCTSAGGQFKAEVLQDDPVSIQEGKKCWNSTKPYNFTYPFEDHWGFNQISASYHLPISALERVLTGTHVPSMLVSRFELREELEAMKVAPKLLPFGMSTASATNILKSRVTRQRVELFVRKELRKYHGAYTYASIFFLGLVIEAVRIRPVFLPLYKLMVTTAASKKPVPVYVCGATAKCDGPVATEQRSRKYAIGGLSWSGTMALGLMIVPAPEVCAVVATVLSALAMRVYRWTLVAEASKRSALEEVELRGKQMMFASSDAEGYKWSVEDEEKMEYLYREELRNKARKRADFEQRIREEAEREEAMRNGRAYFSKRRKAAPGVVDRDPLGYYKLLGLQGKEATALPKDISVAFRREAQKSHPDLLPAEQQETAKAAMQLLLEAYTVLRDPTLRKEYDLGLLSKKPDAQ